MKKYNRLFTITLIYLIMMQFIFMLKSYATVAPIEDSIIEIGITNISMENIKVKYMHNNEVIDEDTVNDSQILTREYSRKVEINKIVIENNGKLKKEIALNLSVIKSSSEISYVFYGEYDVDTNEFIDKTNSKLEEIETDNINYKNEKYKEKKKMFILNPTNLILIVMFLAIVYILEKQMEIGTWNMLIASVITLINMLTVNDTIRKVLIVLVSIYLIGTIIKYIITLKKQKNEIMYVTIIIMIIQLLIFAYINFKMLDYNAMISLYEMIG